MSDYSKILYIDPGDNLDIVKERIKETEKQKVILVLPEENKNLKNIENLTILKKEAQKLDKKLSIFSTDNQYRKLAEDCGIEIEFSLIGGSFLNQKGEVSFRPNVTDILPKKGVEKEPEKEPEEGEIKKIFVPETEEAMRKTEKEISKKTEKVSPENKEKNTPDKKISGITILYGVVILLMLAGIISSLVWLPKANIVLYPSSEEFDFSGEFQVKKDVKEDIQNRIIPAIILKEEEEIKKTFSSTGSGEGESTKASGEIIVYNKDTSSHTFVSGTRFKSKEGKIFKSKTQVNIPKGSSSNPGTVKIEVVAAEGGEDYNIAPATFTVPGLEGSSLYERIYGKSTTSMSGGSSGEGTIVSEDDLKNARQELRALQEAKAEELNKKVLAKIPENLKFLQDTIVVEKNQIVFDKEKGKTAKIFTGQTKVSAWVLSFEEKSVQKIISEIVSSQVRDGASFYEILSTQEIKYKVLEGNSKEGILNVYFEGKEKVAWKVEEQKVKNAIFGKTSKEFQEYIKKEFNGKVRAELVLWPFWVNKIPTRQGRVFIKTIYQ